MALFGASNIATETGELSESDLETVTIGRSKNAPRGHDAAAQQPPLGGILAAGEGAGGGVDAGLRARGSHGRDVVSVPALAKSLAKSLEAAKAEYGEGAPLGAEGGRRDARDDEWDAGDDRGEDGGDRGFGMRGWGEGQRRTPTSVAAIETDASGSPTDGPTARRLSAYEEDERSATTDSSKFPTCRSPVLSNIVRGDAFFNERSPRSSASSEGAGQKANMVALSQQRMGENGVDRDLVDYAIRLEVRFRV